MTGGSHLVEMGLAEDLLQDRVNGLAAQLKSLEKVDLSTEKRDPYYYY